MSNAESEALTRQILAENLRSSVEQDYPTPTEPLVTRTRPQYAPAHTPPEMIRSASPRAEPRHAAAKNHGEPSGNPESAKTHAPDGGYGWVIVFAVFMITVIQDGLTFAFGLLLPYVREKYDCSPGAASAVNSILMSFTFFLAPVASILSDKFGVRKVAMVGSIIAFLGAILSVFTTQIWQLWITYGGLIGIGFGMIYLPAIVTAASWFEKRRATAMGLAVCGTGVGVAIFSFTIEPLIAEYGFHGFLLILSGMVLNVLVFSAMLRGTPNSTYELRKKKEMREKNGRSVEMEPLNEKNGENNAANPDDSAPAAGGSMPFLRMWQYWVMLVVILLCGFSAYIPFMFLVSRAQAELGESVNGQALTYITGGCNVVGRLFSGFISDRKWCNRYLFYSSAYIICGLSSIFSFLCNSFETLAAYGALYGFTGGIIIALQSVILSDIVGIEHLSPAFGISLVVLGAASLAGPPTAGALVAAQNNQYVWTFVLFGVIVLVGGVIFLLVPLASACRRLVGKRGSKNSFSPNNTVCA